MPDSTDFGRRSTLHAPRAAPGPEEDLLRLARKFPAGVTGNKAGS